MTGPRDQRSRRPTSDDDTVEVPLRSARSADAPPPVEPWWKNANQRIPSPPRTPSPPPVPRPAKPPVDRNGRAPAPARNRHARPTSARQKSGQLALLIAVGVVAISVAAVLLMVVLSRFDVLKHKVLNVSKAEAGVARILADPTDGYGATNISDVVCNNGDDPEVKKGGTFTCEVVVGGQKRQVLVVFQDDKGTYEVDRPR
ncbi:MAG TPA: DUF4333 domain-containing protein [Mycobacterium sp.]|nr:DUF4333 domain-containing protein [Mycobacterium sp.]